MNNITDLEMELLTTIYNCEYHDGRQDEAGSAVWTETVFNNFGKGQSAGGVMSSLVKKGLAETEGAGPDDACWLTESGLEALRSHGVARPVVEVKLYEVVNALDTLRFNVNYYGIPEDKREKFVNEVTRIENLAREVIAETSAKGGK